MNIDVQRKIPNTPRILVAAALLTITAVWIAMGVHAAMAARSIQESWESLIDENIREIEILGVASFAFNQVRATTPIWLKLKDEETRNQVAALDSAYDERLKSALEDLNKRSAFERLGGRAIDLKGDLEQFMAKHEKCFHEIRTEAAESASLCTTQEDLVLQLKIAADMQWAIEEGKKRADDRRSEITKATHLTRGLTFALVVVGIFLVQIVASLTFAHFLDLASRLRKAAAFHASIADAIKDSVLTVDDQGKIESFNKTAQKLYSSATPGSSIGDVPSLGESIIGLLNRAQTLYANEISARVKTEKLGSRKIWDIVVIGREKNDAGSSTKWSVIIRDVSERVDFERKINEERAQAIFSGRMAALEEMAAGIGHEISNPLAVLSAVGHKLSMSAKKGPVSGEIMLTEVSRLQTHVERIAGIIRGLRAVAVNDDTAPMAAIGVSEIIDNIQVIARARFNTEGIRLEFVCDPSLVLQCRRTKISQVLLNLLNNAADAVAKLPEKWVQVDCCEKGGFIEVRVTDSGKGIPPHIAARLMEPFFTTKGRGKGTGLGLSISLSIAQEHGGSLILDTSSQNTSFVLRLPLHQAKVA